MNPLVSVICVCYNHEDFVLKALKSVTGQTYANIEIIIVDDGSTDKSAERIEEWVSQNTSARFLNLKTNHGYCKAFNRALQEAQGEYIIDFATDDLMLPERIAAQVTFFETLDNTVGVVFTDADYIDRNGSLLRSHFSYLLRKKLLNRIPQGNVYADILQTYFIPSPTMMARASVFEFLEGYDETLVYEDFDFWVRSSREFKYAYLPERLMKIRRNINSLSSGWYKKGDRQLHSTYLVCRKAWRLNRTQDEHQALTRRLRFELRQSIFSENYLEAKLFYAMLQEMSQVRAMDTLFYQVGKLNLPLAPLRRLYHWLWYDPL